MLELFLMHLPFAYRREFAEICIEIRHQMAWVNGVIMKKRNKTEAVPIKKIKHTSVIKTIFRAILFSVVPIVLFYLMESYEHNAFEEVRSLAQVYNIVLFELIAWILFFITGRGKTALRIENVFACLYGIVNHYIMEFRSTPFVPWDVFSVRTAMSVADNYDFTPSKEMLLTTGVFVVIFLALGFVKYHFADGVFLRIIPVVCLSLVLGVFVTLLQDDEFQTESYLYPFLFTPSYMTKVNGMAVTFAMNLEYVYVEKPEGYSVEAAERILASYESRGNAEEEALESKGFPNIIVIMNEAFSDLSVLGDFTTNEDYMPFLHELQRGYENTVTGNLTVSVCGGNTANSEFEFLTGHTMDFFPVGSIPYQQYIKGKVPSMVQQLADLEYLTYGMHPYNASGWNRDTVYPNLGFADSFFLSDFTNRKYIRNYVSDETSYKKIIDLYEQKEAETPLFAFEVTMQNHSGYTDLYENFTPDIYVEEFSHPALEQYLSLIKVSDGELKELISYFEKEEENTIIAFFGDHQPSDYVVNPILRANGVDTSDLSVEEASLRYIVPYAIWANFDIEEETNADTDISCLGAKVLELAGIPANAYQNFLLEMEAETANAKESGDAAEISAIEEQYKEMYQILQYYFMFDYKM
uniref:sulfatase-like hydrolase/transferase n=1 Tax=Agathobacter sp. TaxID=2021311 RepID=UPI004056E5AF